MKYIKNIKYVIIVSCLSLIIPISLNASKNACEFLKQYDELSVLEVLHDEIPGFNIHSIVFFSNGWTNLVADINNEWIFRFPREESFMIKLKQEQLLLDRLHTHNCYYQPPTMKS